MTAQEEMLGVDAPTFIAAMADMQASWNWAVLHDPGQPVGQIAAAAESELTVAAIG
jgi:hypothetical protein